MSLPTQRHFNLLITRMWQAEAIIGLVATLAAVAPARAQSPDGDMGPGYGHRRDGPAMMAGPRHEGRSRFPAPEEVEGPPAPTQMQQIANLDDAKTRRYADVYARHMAATQPVRDSVRARLRTARAAFEDHDRDLARQTGDQVQRLWKTLSKQDEDFDKGLKTLLDKDQAKQYSRWLNDRKQAADERRRDEMGDRTRDRRPDAGQDPSDMGPR